MKKLILLLVFLTSLGTAFSQKSDLNENVKIFISTRMTTFNKEAKMIKTHNIERTIKDCKRKNISYTRSYFIFYGEDLNAKMCESSKTITKNRKVPFVVYRIHKKNRNTVIDVISGNDSL